MRIFVYLVHKNYRLYYLYMSKSNNQTPNRLIKENSPYLLQHAYNPVDWYPFSNEAFELAKSLNRPVLISIGYSACHWCHVMEHESFEDAAVAALMNEGFINIKVDREERSDVDQLYMQAVQLMTGHGGWPLNCFVMPDGSPFYGGTYFPKAHWINILQNLSKLWKEQPEKVKEYATELTNGIYQSERLLTTPKNIGAFTEAVLDQGVEKWKLRLDQLEGGPNKAPKFPLPSNYLFLLRYAVQRNDNQLLDHVELTLRKMAFGGIFDQVHGGFSRYSTDTIWKVPHFEKMLYDNAQLSSLYTEAFRLTGNPLYAKVTKQILAFVETEWLTKEGFFYSALDADSDGEEGKFYVWKKIDLQELLGNDFEIFQSYFIINDHSYWEDGNHILMRNPNLLEVLTATGLNNDQLELKIANCIEKLRQESKSRIKPALDDKMLSSWNAMMCSAFAQAALVFDDDHYKAIALNNAEFLRQKMCDSGFGLKRTYKNGEAKIDGFLDDYAFIAAAWMDVYLISKNEQWLIDAKKLVDQALQRFNNAQSPLLYYTAVNASELVTRTSEIADNVCPSSNSQMAMNLFVLGHYFAEQAYTDRAGQMLALVSEEYKNYGAGYSNWACLALRFLFPFKEVAIVGKHVDELFKPVVKSAHTNTIFAVSGSESELPLLKNRHVHNQTLAYVCVNNTCNLPVNTASQILQQLETDTKYHLPH